MISGGLFDLLYYYIGITAIFTISTYLEQVQYTESKATLKTQTSKQVEM